MTSRLWAAALLPAAVVACSAPQTEVVTQTRADMINATVRVEIEGGKGTGSGTFVDRRHVLTNFHVAGKEGTHTLRGWVSEGGKVYPVIFLAKVVASDESVDLALLELDGEWPGEIAPLAPVGTSLHVGDRVFAAGSPLGKHTLVTSGEVLLPVDDDFINGLRHTVASSPVVPGNSGGGLWRCNAFGQFEMVGVTRALAVVPMGFGASLIPSLSYFIPLPIVRAFLLRNGVSV